MLEAHDVNSKRAELKGGESNERGTSCIWPHLSRGPQGTSVETLKDVVCLLTFAHNCTQSWNIHLYKSIVKEECVYLENEKQ